MKENNEEKQLALRMYFFVPYNISPIQQAIQAGHAALEYADKFGGEELFIKFVREHKTWVILNGGTTNQNRDFDGIAQGTLNQIADQLLENEIDFSYFIEPDLNDALTALCFIADERVFNREDYPDFVNWLLKIKMYQQAADEAQKNNPALWVELRLKSAEEHERLFPEYYKEWVRFLGGVKNVFLRELMGDKKLA
jgi:hypothetical protein